jgi:integrase
MPTVYRDPRSAYYQTDIWIGGRKFSRSTKCTSEREAEKRAREIEHELRSQLTAQADAEVSLQLDHVAGRYMIDVGDHHAGADNTRRLVAQLLDMDGTRSAGFFRPDTLITSITHTNVAALVSWRRAQKNPRTGKKLSPYTVNDLTEQLKKLFTYCKRRKVQFENEPDWGDEALWLKEPQERVRELHEDERERLEAEMRDDYAPLFEYARLTGKRRDEVYTLSWSEVNWDAGKIVRKGKGDRDVVVDITDAVRELLWPLYQQRDESAGVPKAKKRVFTYVAERTRDGRQEGLRYPVTLNGLKTAWRRLRKRAGVVGFRFHDYRHNFATKLLRATGNLKLTSRALDHSSTRTTERYAHVVDAEVAGAVASLQTAMQSGDKNHRRNHRSKKLKVI